MAAWICHFTDLFREETYLLLVKYAIGNVLPITYDMGSLFSPIRIIELPTIYPIILTSTVFSSRKMTNMITYLHIPLGSLGDGVQLSLTLPYENKKV